MSDAALPTELSARGWIVSARFDLTWFLGGAFLTAAVIGLYFGAGAPILVLWWAWLLGFDGPHIAATFTRTYFDKEEWRSRRRVLLLGLLSFAVGPACLILGQVTGSAAPFLLFLAAATFYGYFHIVRQHYGFLALYKTVNRDFGRFDLHFDKWFLYIGCWAPYFYFLLTHPKARELAMLPGDAPSRLPEKAAAAALAALWALALAAFLVRTVALLGRGVNYGKVAFLMVTIPLYGLTYFLIGRFEPVYAQSTGPDQDFLLISILITLHHNIQYLGLVWMHNRNRYGAAGDFGPARALNRSLPRFLGVCALFSLVYLAIACWTGVFPGCQILAHAHVGPFNVNQIGLATWWGLAIHHYYLDQKIWRIRGDDTLRRNLGIG